MIHLDRQSAIPLYRQIAQTIHESILAGQLKPGDKLPSRLALIRQLNVNLATVRSAFELLESQGLVVSKTGSGTYVSENMNTQDSSQARPERGVIVLVLGHQHYSQYRRDRLDMIVKILAGMEDVLGSASCRYVCVESLDEASFENIQKPGLVVVHRPRQVDPAMVQRLKQQGVPVVSAMNLEMGHLMPMIARQPHESIAVACQHLLDCGYRKLGFIGDQGKHIILAAKFFGFTDTLYRAGLDYQISHVRDVSIQPGQAYRAACELIREGLPEAIVVDTDWKALEVLAALKHAGVRVPEDVGVIGNDGIVDALETEPRLTTVSSPLFEIGQVMARQWLKWLEDQTPLTSVTLESTLVPGDTTIDLKSTADALQLVSGN